MKRLIPFLILAPILLVGQVSQPGTSVNVGGASGGSGGGGTGTVTHNGNLLTGYIALGGTNGTTDITTSGSVIPGTGVLTALGNNTNAAGGVVTVIPHSVTFSISGNGSPLTTGVQSVILNSLYGGTLTSWSATVSPADTITFDILRSADGGAAPSSSIVGGSGTKPNVSSGVNAHSTSFTSWTSTTVTAYDNFKVQITAVGGTATNATVTLYFQ